MKNLLFVALLFCSTWAVQAQDFFSASDAFFKKNVNKGLVNYKAIEQNLSALDNLLTQIEHFPVATSNKNTQLAFYINAYNILTITNVVAHYPINSPMDVVGFFDEITHKVAGKTLTLNQIENDIIRPQFGDARIHFALVCAAKDCPPLTPKAFTPQNVQTQLEQVTQQAINNPNFIKTRQNTVLASEIFKWYAQDFGTSDEAILAFIQQYSKKDYTGFNLDYYNYNWQLNKQ